MLLGDGVTPEFCQVQTYATEPIVQFRCHPNCPNCHSVPTTLLHITTFPLLLCFLRTQRWSDAHLSWSWSWHSWEYPWQASHHRRDDKPHRGLGKMGHEGTTASCRVHVDFFTASEQIWLYNHSKWQRSKSELAKNAKRRNMNTGTEHRNWVILSSMTSLPSAINATLRTL